MRRSPRHSNGPAENAGSFPICSSRGRPTRTGAWWNRSSAGSPSRSDFCRSVHCSTDANPHLIWFYQNLQRGLVLDPKKAGFANDRAVYSAHRDRFNQLIADGMGHTREAAGLFYYLNRTGFNGLCRFNASGFFNVPIGRYASGLSYRYDFRDFAAALQPYTFTCGDFEHIASEPDDFLYADPPYDLVTFTEYSKGGFSWDDVVRLAEWLAKHPGLLIALNAATPRILKLYRAHGFKVKTLPAPRRISCDGNRDDAQEMLATKGL